MGRGFESHGAHYRPLFSSLLVLVSCKLLLTVHWTNNQFRVRKRPNGKGGRVKILKAPAIHIRKAIRQFKGLGPSERVEAADVSGRPGRSQAIPRVVYQTSRSRSVHPKHYASLQQFRDLNSDLDFVCFDDSDVDEYMAQNWSSEPIYDIFRRSQFGQMKADIFRYCLIWDRGGYWFDFTKQCDKPLTSFHGPEHRGLISYESHVDLSFPAVEAARRLLFPMNRMVQWAFGFEKHHPILRLAIDRIVEIAPFFTDRKFDSPKAAILVMTGPGLFTWAVRRYAETHDCETLAQAGIAFGNKGPWRLDGWRLSVNKETHYARLENRPILSAELP